uniref:Uncharacterized protein n=1 Tax=Oryza meridionalis TaxID=40149 RepID=A0A0E0EI02_9ORYZ
MPQYSGALNFPARRCLNLFSLAIPVGNLSTFVRIFITELNSWSRNLSRNSQLKNLIFACQRSDFFDPSRAVA